MSIEKNRLAPLNSILNQNSHILSAVYTRAAEISNLQRILRAGLGPPLSDHMRVANYSSETLTLHTDAPAWAARLRFKIPDILKHARESGGLAKLQSVRIKVHISQDNSSEIKRKLSLSGTSAQLIRKTAEAVSDDALRSALLRLSGHS